MSVERLDENDALAQFLQLIPDPARQKEVLEWCIKMGLPRNDPALPLLVASGMYVAMFADIPKSIEKNLAQMNDVHRQGVAKIAQVIRSEMSGLDGWSQTLIGEVEESAKSISGAVMQAEKAIIQAVAKPRKAIQDDLGKLTKLSSQIQQGSQVIKDQAQIVNKAANVLADSVNEFNGFSVRFLRVYIASGIFTLLNIGCLVLVATTVARIQSTSYQQGREDAIDALCAVQWQSGQQCVIVNPPY